MDGWGYDDFAATTCALSADDYEGYLKSLRYQGKAIGFFGDSHLMSVVCPEKDVYDAFDVTAHIAYMPGATVLGFGQRASSVDHFKKIKKYIETMRPVAVVFKFGQVDLDLGLYYKILIKKEKIDIETYADALLSQYVLSLDILKECATTGTRLYVLPINYPTLVDVQACAEYTSRIITENIEDAVAAGAYRKALPGIIFSYEERVRFAEMYNIKLEKTLPAPYSFIDVTKFFIHGGKLHQHLYSHDDHHYNVTREERISITQALLEKILSVANT